MNKKKKEDNIVLSSICLLDDKKCYIHHDEDGFEVRCRHGSWIEATIPPCQKQLDALEQEKEALIIAEKADVTASLKEIKEGHSKKFKSVDDFLKELKEKRN